MDENYFYGLEDVDFCLRLYKKGYKILFAGNAILFHHESSTRVKSESYFENDKNNYSFFWNRWGSYLSKNLLLDKINSKKFFTEKNLKISIINDRDDNDDLISEISQKFNNLDYTVEVITDMKNNYIGNSSDILISFTDNYDLDNIIARQDILKVIVNNNDFNTDKYDMIISFDNIKSDNKSHIEIKNDFVCDFLEQLQNIIMDEYEF